MKKLGFTLAEVLITLGVIGVVAAITIPGLISNYRKRQLEEQIKVNYSSIQQTMRFMDEEGLSYEIFKDGSDASMKEWYESFIEKHMKVESVCINTAGCWHKQGVALELNGNKNGWESNIGWGINILTFITAKGAYFDMDGHAPGACTSKFGVDTTTSCLVIYFDANGASKPNRVGKDIHALVWTEKGLVPAGNDRTKEEIDQECLTGSGYFCLQKIIEQGWEIPDQVWRR